MAETLHDIGFKLSKADPDVWLQPAVKPTGKHYYEYILCYVDNILAISHDSASTLKAVQVNLRFKDDKTAPPETYLGVQLGQMEIHRNVRWYMLSENNVRASITNIEETWSKSGQKLPNKCKTCWKPSSLLSNVHFRNTTRIAVQVLLLLTLFTFTFEPFLKQRAFHVFLFLLLLSFVWIFQS